jgi:2,3-bisphosphoglycerate-dependent phosphoglycerate mutase/probable phosphoglycerate mutase
VTLRRLVLVRHGQTDFNAEGRMQGHLDSALTEFGVIQARRAGPALAAYDPVRLISSDLARAARSAEEIALACGLPVKLDARLRETHLGRWQGLTPGDVARDWPGDLERWRTDPAWSPPDGESRVAVAARALPVVDELDADFADDPPSTVLLSAHGGVITALTCALLALNESSWMSFGGLGNACWVVLARRSEPEARWRLTGFNVGGLG